jgi:HAE1 family hydrophobic/amphiphilic exporter-1
MIVAYRNGNAGAARRARARLRRRRERQDRGVVHNGERALLAIQKQPGTNTVAVVDASRRCCRRSASSCRRRSTLDVRTTARSRSASRSRREVHAAADARLVVLVIFLFLRNVSATIIPSLALPFSIVGTFAVMYLLGYSLDNLSLMALTLSVGFVVDDAIVMLENIVRHMEMGKTPMQAALDGSKEIGFTIVSMTLSRWPRCSSRCCSWAASSAGCCTSSR